MAEPDARPSGALAPVAVVWCRQVDNEAESPGYTTIPEEFAGRRETLETIRLVGNFTINVADTHDYWDPDPGQPLSYYPNLFLYPAGGRHTCVGRMFLSTEDRPRLGMKTLVFDTSQLVATGEFGAAVLRAHASMGGTADVSRPAAEPDVAVFNAVGEGFLFHRGTTEPVVLVAADQWEAAGHVMYELVRLVPTALVALGAFLSFPYFLPEAKVNLHEFTEQLPLALALMRVPHAEAQGERHAKRLQSWEAAPVTLRDLTRPPVGRGKDNLPLVLQYVRDHAEEKIAEVARRVDLVELSHTRAALDEPERQAGRDRRKEMWRIATAMETAALLLSRPRGRTVPMSGEAGRRANEYLQARPTAGALGVANPPARQPAAIASALVSQLPPWLQRPTEVTLPPSGPVAVPVSVSDDPSVRTAPPPAPRIDPSAGPVGTGVGALTADPDLEAWLSQQIDTRFQELARTMPAPGPSPSFEPRLSELSRELEAKWTAALEARVRGFAEAESRTILSVLNDLVGRLNAVEARPSIPPDAVPTEIERQLRETIDPKLVALLDQVKESIRGSGEMWATELRLELRRSVDELAARSAHAEEELRAALVAQLELEVRETKEQAATMREEVEERVRGLLQDRLNEVEQRRTKDVRDLDQRFGVLLDGRTKDLETKLVTALSAEQERSHPAFDERVAAAERRLTVEQEARASELAESQTQTLAGFQVRMQSFFEQKLRENQEREREKYVELLARFKGEVDQALARTMDSSKFDAAIRDRVARSLEGARLDQEKVIAASLSRAETLHRSAQEESVLRLERVESKLKERETDLARVERELRQDAEEMDRRVEVLTDRMLPLVRKTWVKVAELEKGVGATDETERLMKELKREMTREVRRIEGEMLEQTTELRDRLESTITAQGRIWLNFVRQLSDAGANLVPTGNDASGRPSHRSPRNAMTGSSDGDLLGDDLRASTAFNAFSDDPPNPLDPRPEPDESRDERQSRRRPRRP